MNIALIGFGKMGRELEKIAADRNHIINLKITSSNPEDLNADKLRQIDVAIDFTTPSSVVENIKLCFNSNVPVIVGTTGWYDKVSEIEKLCRETNQALLYTSNFSIGVNIFFEINRKLAGIMNRYPQYEPSLHEIHHAEKKDAPSGTAISIANDIVANLKNKSQWKLTSNDNITESDNLLIKSERLGNVTGTHIVNYQSLNDRIELKHEAFNRSGFAEGAIIAAEWLVGKKGFFTMRDILTEI